MNRIDRLIGILTFLQSRKYVTAEQISDKFEISVRTVYRDIKALGEIGIPISFENNRGYFVMQGYFLPPVSLTLEEANALVLMENLSEKFGDKSIKRNYETALLKIKAIMKGSQKESLDFLQSQIKIYKPSTETPDIDYLTDIQNAISHKTILKIEYQNNQQQKSKREIEPIGLTFYSLCWHVIAWCWLRKEYRDFKISHIINLTNTQLPFKKNKHIDINTYIKQLN